MKQIHVPPLGWLEQFGDVVMIPLMYVLSGTLSEAPQRTHRWNNIHLSSEDVHHLKKDKMVHSPGNRSARRPRVAMLPIFHMPIMGGWKRYIVISPQESKEWHVGWIAGKTIGITKIVLRGQVRMLIGPGAVSFFGIDLSGHQIALTKMGYGHIGDEGKFAKTPLL